MNVTFGRDNLALTVFVPYDCNNNCAFCTSKKDYKINKPSVPDVWLAMLLLFKDYTFPIKDVVFTGGEPMCNVDTLKRLISLVPVRCNVYINTTLVNENLAEFVELVNNTPIIKGINVSRHGESYEEDKALLCNIADDESVLLFKKPVRINCVVQEQDFDKVLKRWSDKGVEVAFRRDFRGKLTKRELHSPYDSAALRLVSLGCKFVKHTFCNVCDTTVFERNGSAVIYHKGTQETSLRRGDMLEINDLIVRQDGSFGYDWSGEDADVISRVWEMFKKKEGRRDYTPCSTRPTGGCGTGGC